MSKSLPIAVLGAGSWGTTLAVLLSENGHRVTLWEFEPAQAKALKSERENKKFLPGIPIPDAIRIENDLAESVAGAELVLVVVPSHVVREVAHNASPHVSGNALVVSAAKGLEEGTLERMSQVLCDELGGGDTAILDRVCSLSGPSHAEEVSRRMPTSVVAAGTNAKTIEQAQRAFTRPYFRVYTNSDLIGVEIGVALKNCIAIAAGVCDGLGYGDNTKAALLTRGMVELTRIGVELGARRETFFGLAGIGDLIATALSRHSRNRHVGERIGSGEKLEQVLAGMVMVAEGVRTTRAAVELGRSVGVELPIIESVNEVLFADKDPREAINELMSRPSKGEMD